MVDAQQMIAFGLLLSMLILLFYGAPSSKILILETAKRSIIPSLSPRKGRPTKFKRFVQGHTAGKRNRI